MSENAPPPAVARVAIDAAACDRLFDYAIPADMAGRVQIGSRVNVPFGRRRAAGYIVQLSDRSDFPALKPLLSVEGDAPLIARDLLPLARWMADYYCAPVEACVRTVLPGAVRRAASSHRFHNMAALAGDGQPPPPADRAALRARAPRQADLVDALAHGPLPAADLLARVGAPASALRALVAKGLVCVRADVLRRDPLAGRTILPTQPLPLMSQQTEALAVIRQAIDTFDPSVVLLYGVTGSGKTEVYLQAIDHALKLGRGAVMLIPEISLTPQTIERFVGRFGARVAVLHSHLSDGERHDEWHRIRAGQADVVIGARSAVFAPIANLGLIVVDEEHEPSYKQSEAPRYNARDVAVMRGHLLRCPVVLGTATPSLESWANVTLGKYRLARMSIRVDDRRMPALRVIDMRRTGSETAQTGIFSRELIEAIRQRLDRAEQTILFLNRRGFSSSLVCRRCGHVEGCNQCSVSCTYHRLGESLRCHMCGAARSVPARCPACGDPELKYSGVGTQRVEHVVHACFPKARVARMDADTTTRKGAHDRVLGDFRAGSVDILIGTQMIAKGLHLPGVTLVGVVYADLSLHMPDFRAGERTFQLLAQVAGRAGRGDISGEVIVQTFTPFHPAIQAVRRLDFEGFAAQELESRRELGYPPWGHLIAVTFKSLSDEKAAYCASTFGRRLGEALGARATVSAAAPAPIAQIKGWYRHQVMVRSRSVRTATGPLRRVLAELRLPSDVTCAVDVDALSLL
jgi:primosomal protein N' (replication factor Y)